MMCSRLAFDLLLRLSFSFFSCSILVRPDFVKLPVTWKNVRDGENVYHFTGNHTVMLALHEARPEQVLFGCGYHCTGIDCENGSYTFSIFIASNPTIGALYMSMIVEPQVVWSGNRDRPVGINATLELTNEGDLVLKDADGTIAWSTGTSGKSVAAMNLTDGGNLVLLNGNNETVWKSFDYPTDTLLLGQMLKVGQKLTHSSSRTNHTEAGLFSLSLTIDSLFASVESNSTPPQSYYSMNFKGQSSSYVRLANGSLDFAVDDNSNRSVMNLPYSSATQYVNLGFDVI